ncbi:MAG: histidine kinase dimerization/phospho-acceptor domain-containing protein [Planctomycetota bacterium]
MTSDDPSAVLVGPAAEALRSQLQELQPQLLVRCFDDLYEAVASLRDERPRSFWIDEKRITGEDVGSLRLLRRLFPESRVMLVLSGRKSKLGDLAVELGFALVPARPELRQLLTFLGPTGTGVDVAEDLVAGIADQLNNPLAALVGRLQLIGLTLPPDLDADLTDNLRLALDSARRLQSSIHKLTLLSRRRTPVPRRQPLGALVLARFTALAGKAVVIEVPKPDPEVLADEDPAARPSTASAPGRPRLPAAGSADRGPRPRPGGARRRRARPRRAPAAALPPDEARAVPAAPPVRGPRPRPRPRGRADPRRGPGRPPGAVDALGLPGRLPAVPAAGRPGRARRRRRLSRASGPLSRITACRAPLPPLRAGLPARRCGDSTLPRVRSMEAPCRALRAS